MPRRASKRLAIANAVLSLSLFPSVANGAEAKNRKITVTNSCDYTVWAALFTSVGPKPSQVTGWEQPPGDSVEFEVEESWGGRIWPRTGCDFTSDLPDYQQCETGGCNGGLECDPDTGTGVLPCSLAEFNIQTEVDHYDTSNVDGFNVPLAITNSADCPLSNCPYNLLETCPDDLQYKNEAGEVVGCLTDCGAHGDNEEYCCSGAHSTPDVCPSSAIPNYSWWKAGCPIAYAYAYDESSGTALFTCTKQVDWTITWCPGSDLFSTTATLPNGTTITQGAGFDVTGSASATSGGDSGGDTSATTTAEGNTSSAGGTGTAAATGAATSAGGSGSSTKASSAAGSTGTGSSSSGSSSSGSSGSSSSDSTSSSSDSASNDDTILGMPISTAYTVLALVAVVVIGGIAFFVYSQNKKKGHHHHRRDDSSGTSDAGSSEDDDEDSGEEKHHHGRRRRSSGSDSDSSNGDYSLAKLDELQRAEQMAARLSVYSAAARNPTGLSGVLSRGDAPRALFELPSSPPRRSGRNLDYRLV